MPSENPFQAVCKGTSLPLYRQIKDHIRTKISDRSWIPGQKIPSENELVQSLGVSRMTVNRALRELSHEGLLNRVHGIGTFVAEPPRHASLITLRDIADEVRSAGDAYRCQLLNLKTIKAEEEIAHLMEVPPQASLFHLRAVHFQNEIPIQLEDRLVNPEVAPDFIHQDFDKLTATQYLIRLGKPDEMEHIVQAVLPDSTTAKALAITPESPCLRLSRRTWFQQSVVTRVLLFYPGDRYDLAARYQTEQYLNAHAAK